MRTWSVSSQAPGSCPEPVPVARPQTISLPPRPLQDTVLLAHLHSVWFTSALSVTESKNIKPGPICWPTDEQMLWIRGDWQPIKAVRSGTCCLFPPLPLPSRAQEPMPKTTSRRRGWLSH